jgi:hypothetical protein
MQFAVATVALVHQGHTTLDIDMKETHPQLIGTWHECACVCDRAQDGWLEVPDEPGTERMHDLNPGYLLSQFQVAAIILTNCLSAMACNVTQQGSG